MAALPTQWRDVPLQPLLVGTGPATSSSSSALFTTVHETPSPASQPDTGKVRPAQLRKQYEELLEALSDMEEKRDRARVAAGQWQDRLAEAEAEHARLCEQLTEAEMRYDAATQSRDEYIRLATEQSKSIKHTESTLELKAADNQALVKRLREMLMVHDKLQTKCDSWKLSKNASDLELSSALSEVEQAELEFGEVKSETGQLEEIEASRKSPAANDCALHDKLQQSRQTSVDCMKRIRQNEVKQHSLLQGIDALKILLGELTCHREEIQRHITGDVNQFSEDQFERDVSERKRHLQDTVGALQQSLQTTESQSSATQQNIAEFPDDASSSLLDERLNALMDQFTRSCAQLEKKEQAAIRKQARFEELTRKNSILQPELEKVSAERSMADMCLRPVAKERAILEAKNNMITEALRVGVAAQERADSRLRELNEKEKALQIDNAYISSRVHGNDWDISSFRLEIKRLEVKLRTEKKAGVELAERRVQTEALINRIHQDMGNILAEMECLREQDMLDEVGRTKAIIIEAESDLLERLQINEFLMNAQQARNPVQLLVEKISAILDLVHKGLSDAERFAEWVEDSQRMASRLRSKNQVLRRKLRWRETWKARMLQKVASRAQGSGDSRSGTCHRTVSQVLPLGGLDLTTAHLSDLLKLMKVNGHLETVSEVMLQENKLDSSSLPALCELVDSCPRLSRLDLSRNALDQECVDKLQSIISAANAEKGVPTLDHEEAACETVQGLVANLEDQSARHSDPESDSDGDASDDDDQVPERNEMLATNAFPRDDPSTEAKKLPTLTKSKICSPSRPGSRAGSLASASTASMWSPGSSGMSSTCMSSMSSISASSPPSLLGSSRRNVLASPGSSRPQTPGSAGEGEWHTWISRLEGTLLSPSATVTNPSMTAQSSLGMWLPPSPQTKSESAPAINPSMTAPPSLASWLSLSSPKKRRRSKPGKIRQEGLRQSCSDVTLPKIAPLLVGLPELPSDDIDL